MTIDVTPIHFYKVGDIYVPSTHKAYLTDEKNASHASDESDWIFEHEIPVMKNDLWINNCLKAMYKCLLYDNWPGLRKHVISILNEINYGKKICLNKNIEDVVYTEMLHILVEIAFKNRDSIHNRIRNLYFTIESKFFMQ